MELAALLEAIDQDDDTTVASILSLDPGLARIEMASEYGHTHSLLHRAIPGDGERLTGADLAIVRSLLDAGAAVDALGWGANNGLCTPITMAAWGGHAPMIRLLLGRDADPNGSAEQVARGHRPIDTAADHGHTEAVEALIEAGAEYSIAHLLKVGAADRVETILAADRGAASRPLEGGTPPMHVAMLTPKGTALIEPLLRHGADVDAVDALGRTALHVAIENQSRHATQLMIERGASVDLFAAAGLKQSARAAALLERQPSLAQAAHADGVTALFYAAWSGDERSTRRLLEAGAAVSPRAMRFWACLTPLHAALQQRHREVITALLEWGADVNACAAEPGRYWPTPLHAAARWGTFEEVTALLDHGADPNGGSPVVESMDTGVLAWAARAGDIALVQLLLERGLEPSAPRHREALHLAAERGHTAMVRLLIDHGADPRAVDACGRTPLDRARASANGAVAALLEAECG